MKTFNVYVSYLVQTKIEVVSEDENAALKHVEESLNDFGVFDENAIWTQCTTSKILKKDLEIIQILEESKNLEVAKRKIIEVINRETGENYESP